MTLNTKKIKELENALDSLNIKVTSVNEKIKSHNRSHSNSKDPDLKNKKMVSINNEIASSQLDFSSLLFLLI